MAKSKNNKGEEIMSDVEQENVTANDNIDVQQVIEPTSKVKVRKSEPQFNKSHIPFSKPTGMLVSRLNNPVYISYGNSSLLLPPRGKIQNLNPEMLGSLPKGIDFVVRN